MSIYDTLAELNITLPPVATPAAAYVPFVQTGNLVFLSGHIAKKDGKVWTGQFGKTMTTAEGQAAARAVGLHELITALPQGYDSQVGREGAILSGGQRQRVGLARAIYGKPAFVVLDEPNSSLDEQGDAALASAISLLAAQGTTFVVMTHRTSVLGVTDKMLVLREGQAQMFGPRDDVLKALNDAAAQARPVPAAPAQAA